MKIGIIGYGKMGKAVEEVARSLNHNTTSYDRAGTAKYSKLTNENTTNLDILIDFTHPDSVPDTLEFARSQRIPLVIGTTGWYHHLQNLPNDQSPLLYAPNFSIGMNLFSRVVEYASKLINQFPQYDIAGMEYHHNQKVDAPSGTALHLAGIIEKQVDRKSEVFYGQLQQRIKPDVLHFSSLRCGSFPGTHQILFDSPADTLTLTHAARNREDFALGAVLGAEWLLGRTGIYTLDDMITDQMGGNQDEL